MTTSAPRTCPPKPWRRRKLQRRRIRRRPTLPRDTPGITALVRNSARHAPVGNPASSTGSSFLFSLIFSDLVRSITPVSCRRRTGLPLYAWHIMWHGRHVRPTGLRAAASCGLREAGATCAPRVLVAHAAYGELPGGAQQWRWPRICGGTPQPLSGGRRGGRGRCRGLLPQPVRQARQVPLWRLFAEAEVAVGEVEEPFPVPGGDGVAALAQVEADMAADLLAGRAHVLRWQAVVAEQGIYRVGVPA